MRNSILYARGDQQSVQLAFSSVVLLFWGWQVQWLPLAIIMAILASLSLKTGWRWQLNNQDFNRIADLCVLLMAGAFLYYYNQLRSIQALLSMTQLLPALIFMLWGVQLYSQRQAVNYSALSWRIRRQVRRRLRPEPGYVDITFPYIVLCLLAASTANQHTIGFFLGFTGLLILGLWLNRPPATRLKHWLFLMLLAVSSGYLAQQQLHQWQLALEEKVVAWFETWLWQNERNWQQQTTALGDMEPLKTSNRIRFRVQQPWPKMQLLAETYYNHYYQGAWQARITRYPTPPTLQAQADGTTWRLQPDSLPIKPITPYQYLYIYTALPKGNGLLALPEGTYQLSELPVGTLQGYPLGAIRAAQGPSQLRYRVDYGATDSLHPPPQAEDYYLLPAIQQRLQPLLTEIGLIPALPPSHAAQTLQNWFTAHFRYRLGSTRHNTLNTPDEALYQFLYTERQGHCEYFATATALLLRAAGIPSRYVSGYSVQEYDADSRMQIVRQRHAHAWVQAYWDQAWHTLDTTPDDWANLEAQQNPWWQALADHWDALQFQGQQWLLFSERQRQNQILLFLLIFLSIGLGIRLWHRPRIQHKLEPVITKADDPGRLSPFYLVIQKLNQQPATARLCPSETLPAWLHRLAQHSTTPAIWQPLLDLLVLHERYRFDPQGLTPLQYQTLVAGVQHWLSQS